MIDPFQWATDEEGSGDEPLFIMPTPQRFREIPPGSTLVEFDASLQGGGFGNKGQITLKFVVENDEKYKALPLTDYIGMMFKVRIVKRDKRRRT